MPIVGTLISHYFKEISNRPCTVSKSYYVLCLTFNVQLLPRHCVRDILSSCLIYLKTERFPKIGLQGRSLDSPSWGWMIKTGYVNPKFSRDFANPYESYAVNSFHGTTKFSEHTSIIVNYHILIICN